MKALWSIALFMGCVIAPGASAQSYKLCAGYFWAMQQCARPGYQQNAAKAFMQLARAAAIQEGKPPPLTSDEAAQQMSADLQLWLSTIGVRCEDAVEVRKMYNDACVQLLRQR